MKPTAQERFFSKVYKTDTCWLWTGACRNRGYGAMYFEGRPEVASRLSYRWFVGPIPENFTVDHICRVTRCVNPDHLRVMSMIDNVRLGCDNARVTTCPKGHLYDAENTFYYRKWRFCRRCSRAKSARARAKRAALKLAANAVEREMRSL